MTKLDRFQKPLGFGRTSRKSTFVSSKIHAPNRKVRIKIQTVGTYEEMVEWRRQYLDWLSETRLNGKYFVTLRNDSRTWVLEFTFTDSRDATWFKLVWSGTV